MKRKIAAVLGWIANVMLGPEYFVGVFHGWSWSGPSPHTSATVRESYSMYPRSRQQDYRELLAQMILEGQDLELGGRV